MGIVCVCLSDVLVLVGREREREPRGTHRQIDLT